MGFGGDGDRFGNAVDDCAGRECGSGLVRGEAQVRSCRGAGWDLSGAEMGAWVMGVWAPGFPGIKKIVGRVLVG